MGCSLQKYDSEMVRKEERFLIWSLFRVVDISHWVNSSKCSKPNSWADKDRLRPKMSHRSTGKCKPVCAAITLQTSANPVSFRFCVMYFFLTVPLPIAF